MVYYLKWSQMAHHSLILIQPIVVINDVIDIIAKFVIPNLAMESNCIQHVLHG
jgi:hypothetical protein